MAKNKSDQPRRRYGSPIRSGVASAVLLFAVIVLAGCGDNDDSAEADPAAVVLAYQDAMNAHDLDAAVAVFAVDARIVNHPLRTTDVVGEESIRVLNAEVLGFAAAEDAYQFTDIETNGNTVTIGSGKFRNDQGECFGGEDDEIVVEEGLVVRWDWGTSNQPCN